MVDQRGFLVRVSEGDTVAFELQSEGLTIDLYQRDGAGARQVLHITCTRGRDGVLITNAEEWTNPLNQIAVRTRVDPPTNNGDGHPELRGG